MRGGSVMSHTPGPWEIRGAYIKGCYTQIYAPNAGDGNGGLVAQVGDHCENAQADARLIVEAPRLLAACKLCLEDWQTIPDHVLQALRRVVSDAEA